MDDIDFFDDPGFFDAEFCDTAPIYGTQHKVIHITRLRQVDGKIEILDGGIRWDNK
jgi:hypothetical protein